MAQIDVLVDELKRALKARGLTYAALARALSLSESSVKRLFATRNFSLRRFEDICNVAGVEISDLVRMANERREYLTELTPEQEDALLADPKLLLMTYLLINGWSAEEIVARFKIDMPEAERLLIRLHRAKIIELLPFNRVKLLTARNFTWRKNGPVQRFFQQHVQREFIDAPFTEASAQFRFVGARLSRTGLAQMHHAIERIAREFDELARRDEALPVAERQSCAAVFAIRPWEFSVFAALRRDAPTAGGNPKPADGVTRGES